MENVFTTSQAAAQLGVSKARVRKLIKERRIAARKDGRDHFIQGTDLFGFVRDGRKNVGRPPVNGSGFSTVKASYDPVPSPDRICLGSGEIIVGDAVKKLADLPSEQFQLIIADPPYFQVLLKESWDNSWKSPADYLNWMLRWVREAKRTLRSDGLFYIFGQLGKREHVWLHLCSLLANEMQFHDMLIWDRAVGYNERGDSFTPQYEMILSLRKEANAKPYFDKDAVRLPYEEDKIEAYLKDKRYKDKAAREKHLRKGKYATNIWRIPSLKGASKEKAGHPSQKPVSLISRLIASSSRVGDLILDPFFGSGTTGVAALKLNRRWVGIEAREDYAQMSRERINRLLEDPELDLD